MTVYISLDDENIHSATVDEICIFFLKLQIELQ